MFYQNGRVGKKRKFDKKFKIKNNHKIKVLVKLFQKLAVSKGRAFGRSNERNGGVGAAAPALQSFKKVFWQPFYKKRLGGFQPPDEIFSKLRRVTNGRPYKNKSVEFTLTIRICMKLDLLHKIWYNFIDTLPHHAGTSDCDEILIDEFEERFNTYCEIYKNRGRI